MSVVAVIGAGRMGLPICARLVGAGFPVVASDLDTAREPAVRAIGADFTPDSSQAVAGAEVVLTVLPGARELAEVAARVVERLAPQATWIDMTSANPAAAGAWVTRATQRGVHCLDAPMGGGVSAAQSGTLQLFVGGPAQTLERQRPLLASLGTVEHVGDSGAGYTTKLLVNLLWFGQAVACAEALLLARRAGLDLDAVSDTLTRTAAASDFIRRDLPALLTGDYRSTFGVDRCRDQLAALSGLARDHAVPFGVSDAVCDLYDAAVARYGPIDGELLAVALLEERAGVTLSAAPLSHRRAGQT